MDFTRALDLIFATTENELDCDGTQARLAEYAQSELEGGTPAQRFPLIAAHLEQCNGCAHEYAVLLQLALLEAQQRLPRAEQILQSFPENEPVDQETPVVQDATVVSGMQSEFVPASER